jgi:HAD superfamily hydrolase (TIGR01509 family)
MQWIHNFTLFLFDFDGLLVDTEVLHYKAYREMCRLHGVDMHWSLNRFFEAAHFESTGLRQALYTEFPKLLESEPRFEILYAEKKAAYQRLLMEETLELMPGAGAVLEALHAANIRRSVVTNSPKVQVDAIREKIPALNTIPLWITRECYKEAKPNPEGYLLAIEKLGKAGDKIVGFEDSTRGLKALIGAGVTTPVLICPPDHPQLKAGVPEKARCFHSFEEINNSPYAKA